MPDTKPLSQRLQMLIRSIASVFSEVTGTKPTIEQIKTVEIEICKHYGGERVYVPSHPKARKQAEVAKLLKESKKTQREMARALGVTDRGLRKSIKGK